MKKIKLLVLTDHSGHSKENSLYELLQEMQQHPNCEYIDIASRGIQENKDFFHGSEKASLYVSRVKADFAFSSNGEAFQSLNATDIHHYDAIFLRLPPLEVDHFFRFLEETYPNKLIINNPSGILTTGSKEFLVHFPSVTPPLKVCTSFEEIDSFKSKFPIVLKPFRNYGGHGIVRIENDEVNLGNKIIPYDQWKKSLEGQKIAYLGVQFLKNVSQGDKRIVVVDGQIIGASLRLPSKGSWLCNAAQGGTSNATVITAEEEQMVKVINPILSKLGIVMYGVDTLTDDNGKRVLSEINTTSIGGLRQIQELYNQPILKRISDRLWNYLIKKL
jgi:glutathione synthase